MTSPRPLTIALAQVASRPGDIAGNLALHLRLARESASLGADLVVFSELSLTGCDVLGHMPAAGRSTGDPELQALAAASRDIAIAVGFVECGTDGHYYNSLAYLDEGRLVHVHRKVYLVSAEGISERRMFSEGRGVRAFATRFGRIAMLNCEDAWHLPMPYLAVMDGAELLLTLAATPYGPATQLPSDELWRTINRAYAIVLESFNVFVNRVGDEGSLRFFGGSHVVDPRGSVVGEAPLDAGGVTLVEVDLARVAQQRYEVSYVRDERLALTARGLTRLLDRGDDSTTRRTPQ